MNRLEIAEAFKGIKVIQRFKRQVKRIKTISEITTTIAQSQHVMRRIKASEEDILC